MVQNSLFETNTTEQKPLWEKLRPQKIEDVFGQDHLLDKKMPLFQLKNQEIFSIILFGPAGVGKTTLCRILSQGRELCEINAKHANTEILKKTIETLKNYKGPKKPVLFVDEIHNYTNPQQNTLLEGIEKGYFCFICATTENPTFHLNSALRSRCHIFHLKNLDKHAIENLILSVEGLYKKPLPLEEDARDYFIASQSGDGRKLISQCELLMTYNTDLSLEDLQKINLTTQQWTKDLHYDYLSVFHKACRASDVNGALYWAARYILNGEGAQYNKNIDHLFRRLTCVASEDIGMSDPQALIQVETAYQVFQRLGWPEGRIPLSQAICYVATAPKSNASYLAFEKALQTAQDFTNLEIPKLFKDNHADNYTGYQGDHISPIGYLGYNTLPEKIADREFYQTHNRGFEREIQKRLDFFKAHKQDYTTQSPKNAIFPKK